MDKNDKSYRINMEEYNSLLNAPHATVQREWQTQQVEEEELTVEKNIPKRTKKTKSKRQFFLAVKVYSFFAIMAFILYWVIFGISYYLHEYRYVDGWYKTGGIVVREYEKNENIYVPTDREIRLFEISKSLLLQSETAKKYSFLDWEIVRDTILMCMDDADSDNLVAMYLDKDNCVYLVEHDLSDSVFIRVFIHELIHAASYGGVIKVNLNESMAEHLTFEFLDEIGLYVNWPSDYKLEIWEFDVYNAILGDELVELIYSGDLSKIVNKYTRDGFFEIACSAILDAKDAKKCDNDKKYLAYLRVAQDVYVHFARAYAYDNFSQEEAKEKCDKVKELLFIKEAYFFKKLNK